MKKRVQTLLLLALASLFIISGCTHSQKTMTSNAQKVVKQVFSSKKIIPNQKLPIFSFYLPQNLSIVNSDKNNAILKYGNKRFILFVNPKENSQSKLNYNDDKKQASKSKDTVLKKIDVKDSFTYILLKKISKDKQKSKGPTSYEFVVSSGGIKMTTETTSNDIVNNAKIMAKIIHSVVVHKKS